MGTCTCSDQHHNPPCCIRHCQRVTPLAITTRASQEELRQAVQQLAQQQAQQLAEDGKIYFSGEQPAGRQAGRQAVAWCCGAVVIWRYLFILVTGMHDDIRYLQCSKPPSLAFH
jgi:hypothetical protein